MSTSKVHPLLEKTFKNSVELPCRCCDGMGYDQAEMGDFNPCAWCGGSGMIRREVEGVVRIYPVMKKY